MLNHVYEHALGIAGGKPANTRRLTNAGLMLAHRLRRWPSTKPALVSRVCW